jgi:hypothetical protein
MESGSEQIMPDPDPGGTQTSIRIPIHNIALMIKPKFLFENMLSSLVTCLDRKKNFEEKNLQAS